MSKYYNKAILNGLALVILMPLLFFSCKKHPYGSQFNDWKHNRKGRKEVLKKAPANMVYIPSGRFIMGELDAVTTGDKNTLPHIQEVEAFYIDQTEVTNKSYSTYLNWLRKVGGDPMEYRFALPDSHAWHRPMSYNEPYVRDYLHHPAYQYYPVVGVTWVQASLYCEWRTARINELDSMSEDSIVIRLPSELEWEYASMANWSFNEQNMTNDKYFSIRQKLGFGRGKMMHNFKRSRGDVGGLAHRPNDAGLITAPVYMYEPNEFGLYNMAGNVAEWVGDAYVPVTIEDIMELENPGEEMYSDSLKKDKDFVTPDETFARIMDSLGIAQDNETEVETDITGAILRVYKGGSWNDRAYYLTSGARRFLPQNAGTDYIGFRCAADVDPDLKKDLRSAPEREKSSADSSSNVAPDSAQVYRNNGMVSEREFKRNQKRKAKGKEKTEGQKRREQKKREKDAEKRKKEIEKANKERKEENEEEG